MTDPALALVEFDSIAAGIQAGDAMVKKAAVGRLVAGTVQPGHFLVLVSGDIAPVQESLAAGLEVGGGSVINYVYLPGIHPDVAESIATQRRLDLSEALGIVETTSVASAIQAADTGLKAANVTLLELRLADGLGGKGLALLCGSIADVEAAVEAAAGAISDHGHLLNAGVVPQLHADMIENLHASTRFRARVARP